MIALALTASLIVQTYGGQSTIWDGLTEAGCREALCAADRHMSCAEAADADARLKAAEEAQNKACQSQARSQTGAVISMPCGYSSTSAVYDSGPPRGPMPTAILRARCVP